MSEETKEPSTPRQGVFREARGVAVQSFAGLEQALCTLFADLIFPQSGDRRALRKNDQAAAVIFFNINSMPSRLDIMSQLMKIKYSAKYTKFWNSVREQIKTTNGQRNRIVHWIAISQRSILLDGLGDPRTTLRHPTFWHEGDNEQEVTLADIIAFSEKCDFYSHVLRVFSYLIEPARQYRDNLDPDAVAGWEKVFQEKLEYPLPPNSQLPPNPQVPARPRDSQ